jgi:hypothetical protein
MRLSILPLLLCLALAACARKERTAAEAAPASADTAVPERFEVTEARPPSVITIPYTMVRHPVTRAVMPRLTAPGTPQARAVDAQLDSMAAAMSCGGGAETDGKNTWFEYEARVSYASDSVLSVPVRASWSCGGPSPTNGANLSATFDLRTGRLVEFTELWANWSRDGEAIMRAIFPEQTAQADRVAGEEVDPNGPDACHAYYAAEELATGNYLRYAVSDSGLVVETDFPQVAKACGEVVVVPFERLRPFAAPGGILVRVANREKR